MISHRCIGLFSLVVALALRQDLSLASHLRAGATQDNTANRMLASTADWKVVGEDESGYEARHECSFAQAGDKFYMMGGREVSKQVHAYDFKTMTWSRSYAKMPFGHIYNHFQATEHHGLLWIVTGFIDNAYPTETVASKIAVYDPANDVWMEGPTIPEARRRGGAGLGTHNGKFYIVGGNTDGHNGGYVDMFDEYDPALGTWKTMPSAPNARDHFAAVVMGDELYAVGGRKSGGPGGTFAPLVPEVDVYNFQSQTWSTLHKDLNLPTPRAGTSTVVYQDQILVIGGEGSEQAYGATEAYDPKTQTWTTLPEMNFPRHGTQALVSGGAVFIAGGSPRIGGGRQKNMEVFGGGNNDATGDEAVAGVIVGPSVMEIEAARVAQVTVRHTSGNQGVFVTSMTLKGTHKNLFRVMPGAPTEAFLVEIGSIRTISIYYMGGIVESDGSAHAHLILEHSGGKQLKVDLHGVSSTREVPPMAPIQINVGSTSGDRTSLVSGHTRVSHKKSVSISGDGDAAWLEQFQSHRWGTHSGLSYTFENLVPRGDYMVELGFAETHHCLTGGRIFDVALQGNVVWKDLDIFAEVGCTTSLVRSFQTKADNKGHLIVGFQRGKVENPMVSVLNIYEISLVG